MTLKVASRLVAGSRLWFDINRGPQGPQSPRKYAVHESHGSGITGGFPWTHPINVLKGPPPYEHVKTRLGLPVDDAEAEEVPVVGVGLLPGSPFVNAWSKIMDALGERRGKRE